MPNAPELKHRKVFVVELTRKPLFPGIYTPLLVTKNERLIREIMDAKKHGGQAYVGAFLRRPDAPAAAGGGASAAAKDAAAELGFGGVSSGGEAAAAAGAGAGAGGQQQAALEGAAGGSGGGDAGGGDAAGDAAAHLYEVGTFAQVHTVVPGDAADSAHLLLLGHRRLRREATVRGRARAHTRFYCSTSFCRGRREVIGRAARRLLCSAPLVSTAVWAHCAPQQHHTRAAPPTTNATTTNDQHQTTNATTQTK